MYQKFTFLLVICIISSMMALSQNELRTELTADYGPPSQANTWEKFVIPLTAASFNTDEATFAAAMTNITSFWIRTELHTGYDIGGIDEVMVGDTYWSYFESSSELWSSGGDGTMEWVVSDGVNDGFLQISDWASGDWHWLIAPSNWSGDWSSLIGQDIEFWFKTDQPSYSAIIKLTTEPVPRLTINLPNNSTVPLADSVLVEVQVVPTAEEDITVLLTSSDNNCINVPGNLLIPAGYSTSNIYAKAALNAAIGCESVVEATASGFLTSRMTIRVEGYSETNDVIEEQEVSISPNPCIDKFILSNVNKKNIERLILYDLSGNIIQDLEGIDLSNSVISVADLSAGIYILKIFMKDKIQTSKIIVE